MGGKMTNLLIEHPIVNHSLLTKPPRSFLGATLQEWARQNCNAILDEPILAPLYSVVVMNQYWSILTMITKPNGALGVACVWFCARHSNSSQRSWPHWHFQVQLFGSNLKENHLCKKNKMNKSVKIWHVCASAQFLTAAQWFPKHLGNGCCFTEAKKVMRTSYFCAAMKKR